MPEGGEGEGTYIVTVKVWEDIRGNDSWHVKALHADGTLKESTSAKRDSRLGQGLVSQLDSTCTFKRGNVNAQTSLWPPMWRKYRSSNTDPPSIQQLQLKGIDHTCRSLILDLGPLRLQVTTYDP